jgi:YfiH family protein
MGPDRPFPSANGLALVLPVACHSDALMAFSLRRAGPSPPPTGCLDFSMGIGDSLSCVERNFKLFTECLSIDSARILTCRQVHGDSVAVLDTVPSEPPRADAIIAPVPGLFPAIATADCLPILMVDPVRKISAAVHAGWRGTVLRITRKVLRALVKRFGVDPRDLTVGLGPAIGPCCYEVDDAVLNPLKQAIPDSQRFVRRLPSRSSSGSKQEVSRRLDLAAVNRFELTSMGVAADRIISTDLCTACHPDLFFSYRRDGNQSGRHLSVVGLRELESGGRL